MRQKLHEILAKLRKEPVLTPYQKLQPKTDSMALQAQELDSESQALKSRAGTFATRAESTSMPTAPPQDRERLFERDPKSPPSEYETQMKAYSVLIGEWRVYAKEVRAHNKKLDQFAETVQHMKGKHVEPGGAIGKREHDFIGLENAVFQLKGRNAELSKAVAAVPLPVEK